MLKTLWHLILRFFGLEKTMPEDTQIAENSNYTKQYEDIEEINFTAIFAEKLTTLSVTESDVEAIGENMRAEFIGGCASEIWDKIGHISSGMLGTGGILAVPYVQGGKLYFDLISQDRMVISEKKGEAITNATVLADSRKEDSKTYYRWVNYAVENDSIIITSYVTNGEGKAVSYAPWDDIPAMTIKGVDRVLFSFFKSPVDSRNGKSDYGVPITYGCGSLIADIKQILKQIEDEYTLKEVRIFADDRMFRRDPKTQEVKLPSKLFYAAHGNDNSMIEIFSPEIRDSSYFNRLMNSFELLEKAVGTSKGILTKPDTDRATTATEVKLRMYETYAMMSEIRKALEKGVREYLYCCDVLANAYGLAPLGDWDLKFDWSYNIIENSAETFAQLIEAQNIGAVSKAEIRQYVIGGETLEEAQARIAEIEKESPSLGALLGGGANAD